jgi:hypothetical protein
MNQIKVISFKRLKRLLNNIVRRDAFVPVVDESIVAEICSLYQKEIFG